MKSKSYRDLLVWQKSIALCIKVYKICELFPKSELYGLAGQMKRASVSVPSNVAEGQARRHIGEFLQFLSIASGSLAELDTQRVVAERLTFISGDCSGDLERDITEVQKMLYSLDDKLKLAKRTKN